MAEAEAALSLDFSALFHAARPRKPRVEADATHTRRLRAPASESPCLVLQHYASAPQLLFGEVAVRTSATRTLVVRNEANKMQKLEVRGLEPRDALRVYPSSFSLGAHSECEVMITWAPSVTGLLQKRVEFKWNGADVLHAQLRGSCTRARGGSTSEHVSILQQPQDLMRMEHVVRAPLSPSSANSVALARHINDQRVITKGHPLAVCSGSENDCLVHTTSQAPLPKQTACDHLKSREHQDLLTPAESDAFWLTDDPMAGPIPDSSKKFRAGPSPDIMSMRPKELDTPADTKPKTQGAPVTSLSTARSHKLPGRRLVMKKPERALQPVKLIDGTTGGSVGSLYDAGWQEKREAGYTAWINFMLCEEASREGSDPTALDAGERQRLSLRELEQRRVEAIVRRRAVALLRGPGLRSILTRIEQEVESGVLCVRPKLNLMADVRPLLMIPLSTPVPYTLTKLSYAKSEVDLHIFLAQVGERAKLLTLLGCYNPIWLRIGLETVLAEPAPGAADDSAALRRFMDRRLLSPPANPPPPPYSEGRHPEEAAKAARAFALSTAHRLLLKRLLSLVLLLDTLKQNALLASEPCLFVASATVKSTKAMMDEVCRSYCGGGIGDLAKHLGVLGFDWKSAHIQTSLDEYNFRVLSLATDLRDGVRLTRLVEVLVLRGQGSLLRPQPGANPPVPGARLPAGSRLQKVHNAKIATRALEVRGLLPDGGDYKSQAGLVVDGHREGTLELLRKLITHCAINELAPPAAVRREVERACRLSRRRGGRRLSDSRFAASMSDEGCDRLLSWVQAVCSISRMRVYNLSSSLRDWRALCLLLHHYVPELIMAQPLQLESNQDDREDDETSELRACGWLRDQEQSVPQALIEARLSAFHSAISSVGCVPPLLSAADAEGCGPEEHIAALMLAHLFSRLTDVARQSKAAEVLQLSWRSRKASSTTGVRGFRRALHAIRCQKLWRMAWTARVLARKQLAQQQISRAVRTIVLRRRLHEAAITRREQVATIAARSEAAALLRQRIAASSLQRWHRSKIREKQAVQAVTKLQAVARGCQARDLRRQLDMRRRVKAATMMQAVARQTKARNLRRQLEFSLQMKASILLEAVARGSFARRLRRHLQKERLLKATTLIQAAARGAHARFLRRQLEVEHRWKAAITLQTVARGRSACLKRRLLEEAKHTAAATLLQAAGRGAKARASRRQLYVERRVRATMVLQALVRGAKARDLRRRLESARRAKAATAMQAHARGAKARSLRCQLQWERREVAARTLQAKARGAKARALRYRLETARRMKGAMMLQAAARGAKARRLRRQLFFEVCSKAAVSVQSAVRCLKARTLRRELEMARRMNAATFLEAVARGAVARSLRRRLEEQRREKAAVNLQAAARRVSARALRRQLEAIGRIKAAVVMQAVVRGVKARALRQQLEFLRSIHAATTIQATARGMMARTLRSRLHFARRLKAATTLEAAARGAMARSLRRQLERARCDLAATSLEAAARGAKARRMRRRLKAMRLIKRATLIQAVVRGWKARSLLRKLAAVRRDAAAKMLQATARRALARTLRCQLHTTRRIKAAIALQAGARRAKAIGMRHHLMEVSREKAAVLLQATVRCYNARSGLHRALRAASIMSASWRALEERRAFLGAKSAATIIAAAERARQERAAYVGARAAAMCVQTHVRALIGRRHLLRAVLVVQCTQRSRLARALRRACIAALIKLQSTARRVLAMRRRVIAVAAAVSVQAAARRVAAAMAYRQMRVAAVVVQCRARSRAANTCIAKVRQARLTRAATKIQVHARCLSSRRRAHLLRSLARLAHIAKLHSAARLLQDFFRCRRAIALCHLAATVVTCHVRRHLAQRWAKRALSACTALQARLRGVRIRAFVYRRLPALKEIALRVAAARKAALADPSLWLCNRTNTALDTLLHSSSLGLVLQAVASLEMFSLISVVVCRRMVLEGAVPVLFKLLSTCNRSTPHQKIVSHALRVLANIGERHEELESLRAQPEALSVLIELLQGYRDKHYHATLTWDVLCVLRRMITSASSIWLAQVVLRQPELLKRLESVLSLLQRTAKQNETSDRRSSLGGKPLSVTNHRPSSMNKPPQNVLDRRASLAGKSPAMAKRTLCAKPTGLAKLPSATKVVDHSAKCIFTLRQLVSSLEKHAPSVDSSDCP